MKNLNKKLYITTYGCQMNIYDSDKIELLLKNIGYYITNKVAEADIVIMNTCNIREKAVTNLYSDLGRIRAHKEKRIQENKQMIVVVAGCVAQAEGEEIFKKASSVDIIVGPQSYHSLPEFIKKIEEKNDKLINLEFYDLKKFDYLPEELSQGRISSFLTIQEGCDKFCKFCVVPYTRGAEFSRPVLQIYKEALNLTFSGNKEIILLGQNVNAYHGKDEEGKTNSLADLIKCIAKIKKIERIRYTTSHPSDVSEDLIKLHGEEEKLMPLLHLPVQSGSNKILSSMNRKHDIESYLDIIKRLREARLDIVFSSDFIVGYPGETEEDFQLTLDLIYKVGFAQSYSFTYSPRPGTPASLLEEQIEKQVKIDRLHKLQEVLIKQHTEFNQSFIGKEMEILLEKKIDKTGQLFGKTKYGQNVYLDINENFLGKTVMMKITDANKSNLKGNMLDYLERKTEL